MLAISQDNFAELLAGMPPDRDLAERTTRSLITQACTPRRSSILRVVDAASCLVWTSVPALLCDGRLTLASFGGP